jgi:hypothetical protein
MIGWLWIGCIADSFVYCTTNASYIDEFAKYLFLLTLSVSSYTAARSYPARFAEFIDKVSSFRYRCVHLCFATHSR